MRLIDADALVETMKADEPEVWMQDDYMFGQHDQYLVDLTTVEAMPTVVEWVSVEDRQPRWPGEYIVKYHPCRWDRVWLNETHIGMDSFRGKTTWAKHKYQRVTHWMPTSALLWGDAECG